MWEPLLLNCTPKLDNFTVFDFSVDNLSVT